MLAAVGAVVAFYGHLLFGGSPNAFDWGLHWHYYDWIHTAITRYGTLPFYMPDAAFSPDFLANPEAPLLGPLVGLLAVVPTHAYIKLLVVGYGTAGLLGMYALLRDPDVEAPIAILVALIFTFNGFFVAHVAVGHHMALGSYLLPGIILFYRRAVLQRRSYVWLAAAVNVCSIFEGQQHPFVWNNLFLAVYAVMWTIDVRIFGPLATWLLVSAATAGLAAVKLLPMYAEFAAYWAKDQLPGFPPLWVLWSLVVPGQDAYTISHAGSLFFQNGSRIEQSFFWWEYDFYIGGVACALLMTGLLVGARRAWPWLAVGVVFLGLTMDLTPWTPSTEPWSYIKDLPIWKSQRSPSRFLIVALTATLITAGIGLTSLRKRALDRWPHPSRLHAAAAIAIAVIYADLYFAALPWEIIAVGEPLASVSHIATVVAVNEGTVRLKDFSPNRSVYEVETPGGRVDELLQFSDTHWRLANYETTLPAGKQDIVVIYTPPFLRLGLFISVATAIVALISLVRARQLSPPPLGWR